MEEGGRSAWLMARTLLPCTVVLLAISSIAGKAAAVPSEDASQAVLVFGKVALLSPSDEVRQVTLPGRVGSPSSRSDVHCIRIDLQPHNWSWKELIWGTVEAEISVSSTPEHGSQELSSFWIDEEGDTSTDHATTRQAVQLDNWQRNGESSGTEHIAFFVALVAHSKCTQGAAVNSTVVCKGHEGAPCRLPVSWSQRSCLCIGRLPHNAETLENPSHSIPGEHTSGGPHSAIIPPQVLHSTEPCAASAEHSLGSSHHSHYSHITKPLVLHTKASIRVPQLSMLLTASGLLVLSSAEPLSRVSAMHVLLGGMLGAGLAHVGVMLAIAAVPGAVVALPWVAALSAYRLGICEALAMLVAGYVYTVAMALALLYLYTQHFSYVQAVYLFVMFHAALAGALRAEPSRSSNLGEAPAPSPQVAAILAGGSVASPEQSWVTMWVPGRGVVLQRTVYFALLACGGAMFAGTTNIWLHAAILRAHSSHDLPLWLALFVTSAPVFILVGLEIHCKLLSSILGTVVSLPRGVLEEGAELLRFLRRRLGFYVPGEARGGASRYHLRPVRRVFYSHVLRDQEPGVKWGPERDLWLLRNGLRRVGYWLAGVKPPVTGSSLHRGGNWAGRSLPTGSDCTQNDVSGDSLSDPTWSPSFESSAVGCSAAVAAAPEDDGQEASSAFRELPRGSAVAVDRADATAAGRTAIRESRSEVRFGRWAGSEATRDEVFGFVRAGSEPGIPSSERETHPRSAFLARRSEGGAEPGTENLAERCEASGSKSDAWGGATGWGAGSWGGVTCRDDRDFDENVNEEGGETGALAGAGEEWDWLAAEGLTPGEALAGQSCPVCLSLRKNLAFGCGHQTCQSCGAGLAKCPICRKRISVRVQLFH